MGWRGDRKRAYDKRRKARLSALFVIQGGLCFYCQRLMQALGSFTGTGKTPGDLATVEHLNSRLNPARAVHNPIVIACHACNQKRARLEERALLKIGLPKGEEKNPYRSFPAQFAEVLNNIGQNMRQAPLPTVTPKEHVTGKVYALGVGQGLGLGFSCGSEVAASCIPAM